MVPEDKLKFAKLMTNVAELHNKKLTTQLLEIYWRSLVDYELTDIRTALNTQVKDPDCGQFMPKPADIIRFITGNNNDQALLAWSKVLKAITTIGCYSSIIFDDPAIHLVIHDMGGWIKLCQTIEEKLGFLGNEFQNRYRFYIRNKPSKYPKQLIGIIELANTIHRDQKEPAVLFGDQKLALNVFRYGYEPQQLITTNNLPISKLLKLINKS